MTVRIKICGITSEAEAELAARLGADLVGLNFFARSPRFILEETARAILAVLPPTVEPVALFVNEPLGHVAKVTQELGIATAQVHGDHRETIPAGLRLIPAFPVKDAISLTHIRAYLELLAGAGAAPAAVLVDASVPGAYGGTGQTVPWQLLA